MTTFGWILISLYAGLFTTASIMVVTNIRRDRKLRAKVPGLTMVACMTCGYGALFVRGSQALDDWQADHHHTPGRGDYVLRQS